MPANIPWQMVEKELGTEEAEKNHPAYTEMPETLETIHELIRPLLTAHRMADKSNINTTVLAWVRRELINRLVKNRELADKVWGWNVSEKIQEATGKGEDEALRAVIDGFALAITEAILDEFKFRM